MYLWCVENNQLIKQIEEVKSILTQTQAALEDGKLQQAADNSCAAAMLLSSTVKEIVKAFNNQ